MTIPASYNLLICLNLFYTVSLFVYDVFGGHHPPECTGAHELRGCAQLPEVLLLKC